MTSPTSIPESITLTPERRKPLALTMGDPSGCGPQISARAWEALRTDNNCACYVIGDPKLYAPLCPTEIIHTTEYVEDIWPNALPVFPLEDELSAVRVGTPDKSAAPGIIASIERAVTDTISGKASGVVTNPISKSVLYEAGFQHPGHTEFLATLSAPNPIEGPPLPVMMLVGGGLRVALATIHVPLMKVGNILTKDLLTNVARITHNDLRTRFGIRQPRIAFSGLNPHAGENGSIGREEADIINPAANLLRSEGIHISDAQPGDTVFAAAINGTFDAVIAMTHDQGLIPVKTLDMWGGVNCTLGLPIIRTSPDHGTAFEAAAAGTARPDSLIAAIKLAADLVDVK